MDCSGLEKDVFFMRLALRQADLAGQAGEVPVGAVLVDAQGQLLAACANRTITQGDPTAHAEMLALREGASRRGNYRLLGCTLYATLEPCPMCAGALIWARIRRLVFGAADTKAGALGSVLCLHEEPSFNHHPEVKGGVLAEKSVEMLQVFFSARRKK